MRLPKLPLAFLAMTACSEHVLHELIDAEADADQEESVIDTAGDSGQDSGEEGGSDTLLGVSGDTAMSICAALSTQACALDKSNDYETEESCGATEPGLTQAREALVGAFRDYYVKENPADLLDKKVTITVAFAAYKTDLGGTYEDWELDYPVEQAAMLILPGDQTQESITGTWLSENTELMTDEDGSRYYMTTSELPALFCHTEKTENTFASKEWEDHEDLSLTISNWSQEDWGEDAYHFEEWYLLPEERAAHHDLRLEWSEGLGCEHPEEFYVMPVMDVLDANYWTFKPEDLACTVNADQYPDKGPVFIEDLDLRPTMLVAENAHQQLFNLARDNELDPNGYWLTGEWTVATIELGME